MLKVYDLLTDTLIIVVEEYAKRYSQLLDNHQTAHKRSSRNLVEWLSVLHCAFPIPHAIRHPAAACWQQLQWSMHTVSILSVSLRSPIPSMHQHISQQLYQGQRHRDQSAAADADLFRKLHQLLWKAARIQAPCSMTSLFSVAALPVWHMPSRWQLSAALPSLRRRMPRMAAHSMHKVVCVQSSMQQTVWRITSVTPLLQGVFSTI